MAIILWNKKYTETLAETLKRFRDEKPEHKNEKVTYAGRLDPMAEGLVLLLTADDVHKKQEFLGLDKVYEIDFICGPKTDTYDILGLCSNTSLEFTNFDIKKMENIFKKNMGKKIQPYPPFSSKPVNGKPLFFWARNNLLDEIIIPKKEIEIYNILYLGKREVNINSFQKKLVSDIESVVGDFRQNNIINSWVSYFSKIKSSEKISIYRIQVAASSGTYMRSLIYKLGKEINIPLCTLKIKRIKIGDYTVSS